MKAMRLLMGGVVATLAFAVGAAEPGFTVNAVRVTAKDVPALEKFYQTAFGLKEVQRLELPGGQLEVMLNFGATVDAAKANRNAQVVIMHRGENEVQDGVAHLIFDVTDVKAAAAAVKAAGGKMEREPFEFGKSGIFIGMGVDPEGNHFEMIQRPQGP